MMQLSGEPQVSPSPLVDEAKARLRVWQKKLLDLTLRNRLLNFDPKRRHGIPLPTGSLGDLEDSIASGRQFLFVDSEWAGRIGGGGGKLEALVSPLTEQEHRKELLKLERKGRESFEESGSHTIYLAIGLLQWFEADAAEIPRLAPLLLVPVQLERGKGNDPWKLCGSDETTVFNPSLIEKLLVEFGIDLREFRDELPTDDAGVDVDQILDRVFEKVAAFPRWSVLDEAYLGFFSFTKQVMYQDLEALLEQVSDNPLLDALASRGRFAFPSGDGVPLEEELDAKFPPQEVFCPLDADSSQLAAILAAARGESFVLQGPPGTGKSQTITNLITHCLAEGKTVLFVSAKMAALEVVHRRLVKTGVERFCLELHSHSAKKKEVVAQLGAALQAQPQDPSSWLVQAEDVARRRESLNEYTALLHRKDSTGFTVREVMGELLGLRDAPRVQMDLGPLDQLTRARLDDTSARLAALETVAAGLGPVGQHPLRFCRLLEWTPIVQDDLVVTLDRVDRALSTLEQRSARLCGALGMPWDAVPFDALQALGRAVERLNVLGRLPGDLLVAPKGDLQRIESALEAAAHRARLQDELGPVFSDEIYRAQLDEPSRKLRTWSGAFFLFAFFMLWSTRAFLKTFRKDSSLPDNRKLLAEVESAREVGRLDQSIEGEMALLQTYLPAASTKLEGWQQWLRTLDQVKQARAALEEMRRYPHLERFALDPLTSLKREERVEDFTDPLLEEAAREVEAALEQLAQLLRYDKEANFRGELGTARGLRQHVAQLREQAQQLRQWCHYRALRAPLTNRPEGSLVLAFEGGNLPVDKLAEAYRYAFLQRWISEQFSSNEALRHFDGESHSQKVERYRELDEKFGPLVAVKAHARLAERVPQGTAGEVGVLLRELQKQRRHLPIRRLFREIAHIRERLKPCLLMSPLSVAQYLAPDVRFDLVIFDEASQLPTPDAIGAIARARQLVVVGDSKQLPPTNFFAYSDDDSSEDLYEEELESILGECLASGLQELLLSWHYRSQHEHLITFSNQKYYESRLLTFAGANNESPTLGVKWVHVPDGVYEKGQTRQNRKEAEALVAEVVRRLTDPVECRRSLGIVTFSVAQQNLVNALLDQVRAQRPEELERFFTDGQVNEPVFVKNLENVQGDERDVILFSICYGPDAERRVSMNFGPLNKDGGERRLNVAATRARQQLVVFSTVQHDQIDPNRTSARGVLDLRTFLRFAKEGVGALRSETESSGEVTFDSPFEEEVHKALTARGHKVSTQVGCSGYRIDLAVHHPQRPGAFLVGVECDGSAYHSAKTARDRDRLRQAVLEDLGWKLHRIWSTDWWHDADRAMKKLEQAIERALASYNELAVSGKNETLSREIPVVISDEGLASKFDELSAPLPEVRVGVAYRAASIDGVSIDDIESSRAQVELALDVSRVIALEGPVHIKLLARRLLWKWGKARISQRMVNYLGEVVRRDSLGVIRDDFVWRKAGDWETYSEVRYPAPDEETPRKLEEIPDEELLAAARAVLALNHSISRSEFPRVIAGVFGVRRMGSKVDARMGQVVDRLLQSRGALSRGDKLVVAE